MAVPHMAASVVYQGTDIRGRGRPQPAHDGEQHQDGQLGGDAGGHDGDGFTEWRCLAFGAVALLADEVSEAR
jgi:hypothetical protein